MIGSEMFVGTFELKPLKEAARAIFHPQKIPLKTEVGPRNSRCLGKEPARVDLK